MPVHNSDIAEKFEMMADLLEIKGANQFRIRAYRDAARMINGLPKSASDMIEKGEDLTKLHGIGKDLAGKIEEIIENETFKDLEKLKKEVNPDLAKLMKIQNLGARRIKKLHDELGIVTFDDLKNACETDKIKDLEGFGEKTQKKILEKVNQIIGAGEEERTQLARAERTVIPLLDHMKKLDHINSIDIAGSYRRRKETVGDVDILITCKNGKEAIDHFVEYEDVKEVVSKGETKSTIILKSGLQVDLRVVQKVSYGAALLYFTGSKAHNITLRKIGMDNDWKINEYGVFEDDKRIAGKTEKEIYDLFDMDFIPPELRENNGEVEAALNGELPELVNLEDIRGDLHCHTSETDGHSTLEEMVKAAQDKGYLYLAITDHSPNIAVTKGLNKEKLLKQMEQIDKMNGKIDRFHVLKGIEVDILEDGSLDLPDDVLEKCDVVVASVHSKMNLSRDKQTKRILKAMDNPHVNIIGHPTCRKIGEREGLDLNLEKIMEEARERGVFLEINSYPERMDLPDRYCKMAGETGVKVAISTDAHKTQDLDYVRFGLDNARRGWLKSDDIINTRNWRDLKKLLKR